MRARELSFLPSSRLIHGGEVRRGRRKLARPIDPKRPLHVVMRAAQARGHWSMLHKRHKGRIFVLVHETADRFGVKVHRFTNVGNHLHLLVRTPSRGAFQDFLRVLTGAIVFLVTGTRKGLGLKKRFWDKLAFSRVVNWGREFKVLKTYFAKNLLESLGIARTTYLIRPLPG
jgi:REP element-mobilizing transposase RayT